MKTKPKLKQRICKRDRLHLGELTGQGKKLSGAEPIGSSGRTEDELKRSHVSKEGETESKERAAQMQSRSSKAKTAGPPRS